MLHTRNNTFLWVTAGHMSADGFQHDSHVAWDEITPLQDEITANPSFLHPVTSGSFPVRWGLGAEVRQTLL